MTQQAVPQSERLHVHLDPAAVIAGYARHRRRFSAAVRDLDAAALASRTRCSEWSVADVLRHLIDVDEWMRSAWAGGPFPFDSFHPNTTPHEQVLLRRSTPNTDVRDAYVATSTVAADDMDGSGTDRWDAPGISPLGFVPWWLSVLHIYWDSWLHERDVLLPLGRDVTVEPDELEHTLTYGLGLAAGFLQESVELVVSGVRIVTRADGKEPIQVTPVGVDPGAAPLVDALAGRGDLTDAPGDQTLNARMSGMARFLRPG